MAVISKFYLLCGVGTIIVWRRDMTAVSLSKSQTIIDMEATSIKAGKSLNLPTAAIKAALVKNSFRIMAISAAATVIATGLGLDAIAAIGAVISLVSLKSQL